MAGVNFMFKAPVRRFKLVKKQAEMNTDLS